MNARRLAFSIAAVAALAAGLQHWSSRRAQSQIEADTARLVAETAETRGLSAETSQRLAALTTERPKRPEPAPGTAAPSPASAAASEAKPAAVLSIPEVREMQVQAFVSDLRLRFAALLKQLDFTPEKLQTFDRIQGECQRIMVDDSQPAAVRQQARQARDAQLKELFGPAFDQWVEANRAQPARSIVAQIVQQTFQGSGALTTSQADQLTRLVGQNRIQAESGPARYNWDQIVTNARSVLAEGQMADFAAAVQFRRASDEMSAIAAKKKP